MNNQLKFFCSVLALAAVGHVSAATTWTLASDYGSISSGVTVTALSNTGGTNNSANAANNGALQTIQTATWTNTWGGIYNADACTSGSYCDTNENASPEHSIDNNQRYDMALLTFSDLVKITDLKLGWVSTDSDVTVMAYNGSGAPTLVGKKYSDLVSLGWVSIGNYSDLGTTTKAINSGGVFSSYWLIGAYNPLANPGGGSVTGNSYDYVKLASVTGCISGTIGCNPLENDAPEPGSMALFGLGLLGLVFQRKRPTA
ncbi:MAG: PEP-CTERM sorting domain-containing protein [Propionivibrio sp.]